jgi:hypothetical protein
VNENENERSEGSSSRNVLFVLGCEEWEKFVVFLITGDYRKPGENPLPRADVRCGPHSHVTMRTNNKCMWHHACTVFIELAKVQCTYCTCTELYVLRLFLEETELCHIRWLCEANF